MKHSRIILAASTCLLAIAGVAATKAHKLVANSKVIDGRGNCVNYTTACVAGTTVTCFTASGSVVYTLNSACATNHQFIKQ